MTATNVAKYTNKWGDTNELVKSSMTALGGFDKCTKFGWGIFI